MKRRFAFTLIELLVVIAIIALLAAILFPVFARARENARKASCQSNEKQLGLAFQQYAQDYDETFPVTMYSPGNDTPRGAGWGSLVYPYVKSVQVYICPSDTTILGGGLTVGGANQPCSYAYNAGIGDGYTPFGDINGKLTQFNDVARTVMLCEASGVITDVSNPSVDSNPHPAVGNGIGRSGSTYGDIDLLQSANNVFQGYDNAGYSQANPQMGQMATGQIAGEAAYPGDGSWHYQGRHTGGANYLLADGHVKWYLGTNVSVGYPAAATTSAAIPGFSGHAEGTGVRSAQITFSPM